MADYSKDYYKILGVDENASIDQIKQAFHNLAFKHHPDRPNGDEKRFKEINEAYQTLSNQSAKQQYDTMRKFGGGSFNNNRASGFNWTDANFGNTADFSSFAGFNDINDIFGSFFNQSYSSKSNRKSQNSNSNIEVQIDISFKESFLGVKKDIKYQRTVLCDNCNGNGYPADAKLKTCKNCNGQGYIIKKRHIPLFGTINEQTICNDCSGSGKIADKKCSHCDSQGYINETKTETINIPMGIRDGDILEITGRGNVKNKKYKSGNLYVHVRVKEDQNY